MDVQAYELDLYNIIETYELYNESVIVYDSGRKGYEKRVRDKIWNVIKDWELSHQWNDEYTKSDISFSRLEDRDLKMYKGKFISPYEYYGILERKRHKKKLQEIIDDNNITHCHIMKNGSYYCDGYCGYTSQYHLAGVYTKEDAVNHASGITELIIKPLDTIKHNEKLQKVIKKLEKHLI